MNVTPKQSEQFESKYDVYNRQREIDVSALVKMVQACDRDGLVIPGDVLSIISSTYAAAIVTRDLMIQVLLEK